MNSLVPTLGGASGSMGGRGGASGSQGTVTPGGPMSGNVDGGPADTSVADGAPVGAEAEWTVFIYGHADHNLAPSMVRDLEEMSQAKLNDKVQVVAMVDYDASQDNGAAKFPTGTFWYRIVGDGQPAKELSKAPELNLDDPSVLTAAIVQAFKTFPAKRYGLIMWDHGGGWNGGFGADSQDGTDEAPRGISLANIRTAVGEAAGALGLKGERPFEFLTFDTCLMSGVEQLAVFQDLAKVYMANAEIDFGDGLDYNKTLSYLAANPTGSTIDFVKAEVGFWDAHHLAAGDLDPLFRIHASWDTSKAPKIAESMKSLSQAIIAGNQTRAVARALYLSSPVYNAGSGEDESTLRDIADVLQSLKGNQNQGVATAAGQMLDDVNNARLTLSAGDLRKEQSGLHIYGAALSKVTEADLKLYPQLAGSFDLIAGWSNLLTRVKAVAPNAIARISSRFTDSSTQRVSTLTINSPSQDTVYIEGILFQERASGDDLVLGTIGHAFVGPGQSTIRWMGRQATYLVDGTNKLPVTIEPWTFTQQGQTIRTPYMAAAGVLSDPSSQEEPTKVFALVNSETNTATHVVIQAEESPSTYSVFALAELMEMAEGAIFTPIMTTFNDVQESFADETARVGMKLPANGQLQFRREAVPAGRYKILAYVEDFWGNADVDGSVIEIAAP